MKKSEAQELSESIYRELKDRVNAEITLATGNQIVARLYNQDKRPTVYTLKVKSNKYGNPSCLVIDTIINEMKGEHASYKVSFSPNAKDEAINVFSDSANQPFFGNRGETLKKYRPIGLLYWGLAYD